MTGDFVRASILALVAAVTSDNAATADSVFDGTWSVTAVTQQGGCDPAYNFFHPHRRGGYHPAGICRLQRPCRRRRRGSGVGLDLRHASDSVRQPSQVGRPRTVEQPLEGRRLRRILDRARGAALNRDKLGRRKRTSPRYFSMYAKCQERTSCCRPATEADTDV
jgi:hypothetical protein